MVGRDSAVSMPTRYGLGGPGIEFCGGEIFRTRLYLPWDPPSLLYNEYRVFPGEKWTRRGVNHPLHLVPRLKKD